MYELEERARKRQCSRRFLGLRLFVVQQKASFNRRMQQQSENKQAWETLTQEQLDQIGRSRSEARARGHSALRPDPKATYGIVCRACTKPNSPVATFCTGCSFPASEWDLQRLPENVFKDLVEGKDIVSSRLLFQLFANFLLMSPSMLGRNRVFSR